ncbi:Ger(x)C family spore germination C-terminal domain-containing protein [Heliorestis convoluta]|uniref:Spore germination protein kc/spore germination b3 gerac, put n=1 Tax=Heliorestis convoluta TaxID=356322 RepID=A0A5Q2MVR5_9FIRM|nr:Ger(x)C family spore germination C-terminal domain-containing protein [Heliorestis convoluta]QGG46278.1 Spore germination protein kc/spore germination b3 gerac, put [Heliorestis convoluta]
MIKALNAKTYIFLGNLIILLLTVGCWDSAAMERRALVMNIGFDIGEEKPLALVLDIHNAKQSDANTMVGPPGSLGPPVIAPRTEGTTIDECVEEQRRNMPRHIDFGLTSAIVITEEAAREGIFPYLSWIFFHPNVRNNSFVIITTTDLQKLFTEQARVIEGTMGGALLVSQLLADRSTASVTRVNLWEAYRVQLDGTGSLVAPLIRSEEGRIYYDGAAIFDGDRMIGTINPEEAALVNILADERVPYHFTFTFTPPEREQEEQQPAVEERQEAQDEEGQGAEGSVTETLASEEKETEASPEKGHLDDQGAREAKEEQKKRDNAEEMDIDREGKMDVPEEKISRMTLRFHRVQRTMDVNQLGPGKYEVHIHVDFEGMLSDANPPQVRYDREDFNAMNEQGAEALREKMQKVIEKSQQELRADLLHIGRYVRAHNIRKWEEMDWPEVYPEVEMHISVNVRVLGATR